jgi:hypothetical protein
METFMKSETGNVIKAETPPAEKTLKEIIVRSAHGGFFGKIKFRINAQEITNTEELASANVKSYKIPVKEWEQTLGPIFNRMLENFSDKANDRDDTHAIAVGYTAMINTYEEKQTSSFHELWQAFSAATDPSYLESFKRRELKPKENAYYQKLKKFSDIYHKEQAILITGTQMRALANIAKGSADWAFNKKQDKRPHIDEIRQYYLTHLVQNPKVSY